MSDLIVELLTALKGAVLETCNLVGTVNSRQEELTKMMGVLVTAVRVCMEKIDTLAEPRGRPNSLGWEPLYDNRDTFGGGSRSSTDRTARQFDGRDDSGGLEPIKNWDTRQGSDSLAVTGNGIRGVGEEDVSVVILEPRSQQ